MKRQERDLARQLRREGLSYNEIRAQVKVSKSTLSNWLDDIPLTEAQITRLKDNSTQHIERAINGVKQGRKKRWEKYHAEAQAEFNNLIKQPWFALGIGILAGEGFKGKNMAGVSNCTPGLIRRVKDFFIRLGVANDKIKADVNIYPDNNPDEVRNFWAGQLNLEPTEIKVYMVKVSRASQGKRLKTQQFGTLRLKVFDVKLQQKILTWINAALA